MINSLEIIVHERERAREREREREKRHTRIVIV
jgi:hypothetical protein